MSPSNTYCALGSDKRFTVVYGRNNFCLYACLLYVLLKKESHRLHHASKALIKDSLSVLVIEFAIANNSTDAGSSGLRVR